MKTKHKQRNVLIQPRKASQSTIGKWVEKKTRTEILLCSCGAKYLKTRKEQTVCIRCMYRILPAKVSA